ncbi:MAG: MarC family protein [bacterium]|nr:MarC family protein [bacterium]
MPLIAGPGAISTVLIYGQLHPPHLIHPTHFHTMIVSAVVVTTCAVLLVSLRIAIMTGKFIGPTAVVLINRIMGLIVAAIAVNFLFSGIRAELYAGIG